MRKRNTLRVIHGTEAVSYTHLDVYKRQPFKDTAGPAINILIKLLSMVSIVFAGLIVNYALL